MKKLDQNNIPYSFTDHLKYNDKDVWEVSTKHYNAALYNAFKIAGFNDSHIVKAKNQYLHLSNGNKILKQFSTPNDFPFITNTLFDKPSI